MELNNPEAQQKTDALRGFIEKQLSKGVNPKEIYQHLVSKNVPQKLAAELINQSIEKIKKPSISTTGPNPSLTERQQKISKFIQAQLGGGKNKQEVLNLLMEKKVPKEEAVTLIRLVASPVEKPQTKVKDPPAVSPVLPPNHLIGNTATKKSIQEIAADQIAQGVEKKMIVNQLVEGGLTRNEAIDLVVEIDQAGLSESTGMSSQDQAKQATSGRNKMLIGIAALVGGGLFTAASYAAADLGEEYTIFTGPMIFGAIYALVGLIEWLRNM